MNKRLLLWMTATFCIAMAIIMFASPGMGTVQTVMADELYASGQVDDDAGDEEIQPSNEYCLLCHEDTDNVWTLPSGEELPLRIDGDMLAQSVHGTNNPQGPLLCADCHTDHHFPHQPQLSQNVREFQMERYASCRNCHQDQYTHAQDSVHGRALREGRIEAATCVDCHGGHNIQSPGEPRQLISITCGNCHGAVFELYRGSVHGAALLDESNTDVPTCVGCHGVHEIKDPTSAEFRSDSPQVCAQCHADEQLMEKYEISTHVFDSYLGDFHGTTVALFEDQETGEYTNKAVCFDCHGVHNILPINDENSQVIRDNLLTTCRQCHPDADANFPDSWVGHYPPTLKSQPLLYLVNLFYDILIPVTVGGFLLLISTDIFRRIRQRFGK